ncbi:MAG: DnaJ domain-containing protein [Pseudanabaenaceae cyanobacterium]
MKPTPINYSLEGLKFLYGVSLGFDAYRQQRILWVAQHRILELTDTTVWIAEGEYRPNLGEAKAFCDQWGRPFRIGLDRFILEEKGSIEWEGGIGTRFYVKENSWNFADFLTKPRRLLPYLDMLDLDYPFTIAELKQAYRRQALRNHPDRGGDAEKFRKIQAAYEYLLQNIK